MIASLNIALKVKCYPSVREKYTQTGIKNNIRRLDLIWQALVAGI